MLKEMLKNKRNMAIIGALLIVLIGGGIWLAARDGGGDKKPEPKTVEGVIERAEEELSALKSVRSEVNMDMGLSIQGMDLDMAMKMEMFNVKDAKVQKMNVQIDMGDLGAYNVASYTEKTGDGFVVYVSADGGTTWSKQTTKQDNMGSFDNVSGMIAYLSGVKGYKEVKEEKIGDVETTCYEGEIDKDTLKRIMDNTGVINQLDKNASEKEMEKIYEEVGKMKIKVWIDKDKYLLRQLSMDVMPIVKKAMEGKEDNALGGAEISKAVMTYTLSDFNKLKAIELPESVKDAKELDQQ